MAEDRIVQLVVDKPFIWAGQMFTRGVHNVLESNGILMVQAGKGVPANPSQPAPKPAVVFPDPDQAAVDAQKAVDFSETLRSNGGTGSGGSGLSNLGGLGAPADPNAGTAEETDDADADADEADEDLLPDTFPGVKTLRENGMHTYTSLEGKTEKDLTDLNGIAEKTAQAIGIELYKRENLTGGQQTVTE